MEAKEMNELVKKAAEGDREALESLVSQVRDLIFNLSLRMLGTVADAEDATQDILIKIITHLSGFREESSFTTWAYRVAANYLINYRKSMFAKQPLSFEFYAQDIEQGGLDSTWEAVSEEEEERLAEELKYSCTNVMLQCLEPVDRAVFILGTMFKADSRLAGELLDMTPENYRQRLSRLRKKVGSFLSQYCGLSGTGSCSCKRRVPYAVSQNRLRPGQPEYGRLEELEQPAMSEFKEAMEEMDELSLVFEKLPAWKPSVQTREFLEQLLQSRSFQTIQRL